MKKILFVALVFLFVSADTSFAVQMTFFGEDLGLGELTRLTSTPNATSARNDFFSHLTGVGTENFESFILTDVDFGAAGTASLTGSGSVANVPTGTNGYGRYPISGDKYWETSTGSFGLSFSAPIAAFGFYGIDFGDFEGQIEITLANGGSSQSIEIPHTSGLDTLGGSVVYWGIFDTENLFTSVSFSNTGSGEDFFGFDDFSIGSLEQVVDPAEPVPEPATLLLLSSGIAGLAGFGRKKFLKKTK